MAKHFWKRFLAATGRDNDTSQPEAWPFGDSVELADQLLTLVLHGTKRATAAAVAGFEAADGAIPKVSDLEIATDGTMRPRAVLQLTDVRVGPLSSVDGSHTGDRLRSRDGDGLSALRCALPRALIKRGEILQGSRTPDGIVIKPWPDTEAFELAG